MGRLRDAGEVYEMSVITPMFMEGLVDRPRGQGPRGTREKAKNQREEKQRDV